MTTQIEDMEEDISQVPDRGEGVASMEPLLIGEDSRHRGGLTDLAIDLAAKSAGFRRSLPQGLLVALADLVRWMAVGPAKMAGLVFRGIAPQAKARATGHSELARQLLQGSHAGPDDCESSALHGPAQRPAEAGGVEYRQCGYPWLQDPRYRLPI